MEIVSALYALFILTAIISLGMYIFPISLMAIWMLDLLYILCALVWLGMFIWTVPWRNLKLLKELRMLGFMSFMYLLQAILLVFYRQSLKGFSTCGSSDVMLQSIFYGNWLICLLILLTSMVAIEFGYKKHGHITLLLSGIQAIVYGAVFVLVDRIGNI